MCRRVRWAAVAVAAAASPFVSAPAAAQVACATLPNPIVVSGSSDFEPILRQFAVKLAAETPAATIITVAVGSQTTSCAGVKSLVEGTDFAGLPGRYYTEKEGAIVDNACTLASGQTVQVAVSDVFYESCADVPQPRPADVVDVPGPAQAMVFLAPRMNNGATYLTHEEARTIYGCGVSSTRVVAGALSNPKDVYCRDRTSGVQMTLARNLGIAASTTMAPGCSWAANDAKLVINMSYKQCVAGDPGCTEWPSKSAIGFINRNGIDRGGSGGTPVSLAFQARGQTRAFHPDSGPTTADRKNVRDGHYPLWGYVHLIVKTADGVPPPPVADLIARITGAKTSAGFDPFQLTVASGLIPQCAMQVKRSADGGPLSPYAPPETCACAYEALSTLSTPAACTPCGSDSACPCGSRCRHGFCE